MVSNRVVGPQVDRINSYSEYPISKTFDTSYIFAFEASNGGTWKEEFGGYFDNGTSCGWEDEKIWHC